MDRKFKFIAEAKSIFKTLNIPNEWNDTSWEVDGWLHHRSTMNNKSLLSFKTKNRVNKPLPEWYLMPEKGRLPSPFIDECKAIVIHLQRKYKNEYMAVRNYLIELRNLHIIMNKNNISSICEINTNHFNEIVEFLKLIEYKKIHESCINLEVLCKLINEHELSENRIDFVKPSKSNHNYHNYKPIINSSDEIENSQEKIPSLEAFKAYAVCSNDPIDSYEEILLRTIDLLIIMGQRVNEITFLPLDCWVEKPVINLSGEIVRDMNNQEIIDYGINYYAEKEYESRTHWLSKFDAPIAKRTIKRLIELTKEYREIARFQENNEGRLWNLKPEAIHHVSYYLRYFGFADYYNLVLKLKREGIKPVEETKLLHKGLEGKHYYFAKDIEALFLKKVKNHNVLVDNYNKVILKTSEVLSIRPDGAFRFGERNNNIYEILPSRTTLKDINGALGAYLKVPSIFKRRGLTEADGSEIRLTSHMFRHWRNTIYDKAGMSNVQQALSLGRKDLSQNTFYQHSSLKNKTEVQRNFIEFSSYKEKVSFLRDSLKEGNVFGNLSNTYKNILKRNKDEAEQFLKSHATAVHITPFGLCTHDYSQSPCQKHLQCWNNCSHLHRTNSDEEINKISQLIKDSESQLKSLKESETKFGVNKWIDDLEEKIKNMKKALKLKPGKDEKLQVFPNGVQLTIDFNQKRKDSF